MSNFERIRLTSAGLLLALLSACAHQPLPTHPDGAPTVVRNAAGKVLTRWEQVSVTEAGCAQYQQVPVASDIAVTQVIHYWNGETFHMTPTGCIPYPKRSETH